MELSIFHNGQFFIGITEYQVGRRSKFTKYTFGNEPTDKEVLDFINTKLLHSLDNTETSISRKKRKKRINPKRLQRLVAKEQSKPKDLTKAQLAIKKEQEINKQKRKKDTKLKKDYLKKKKELKKEKKQRKNIKATKLQLNSYTNCILKGAVFL